MCIRDRDNSAIYDKAYKMAWGDFMGYMERYDKVKQDRKKNIQYKNNRVRQVKNNYTIPKKPVRTNRWDGKLW